MKCKNCNKEFSSKSVRNVFCCEQCKILFHNKSKSISTYKRKVHSVRCLWCDKELTTTDSRIKFCSQKCRYSYNDKVKMSKKGTQENVCPQCGIHFKSTRRNKKFCCRNHMLMYHTETNCKLKREITKKNSTRTNPELTQKYAQCRRMCKEINRNLLGKNKRYMPSKIILGYSKYEFAEYIEEKFKPEMNWANHGDTWQLDHVRPVASFRLDPEDLDYNLSVAYKCNALTNLTPLFNFENNAKGSWYKGYRWSEGYPTAYRNTNGKIKRVPLGQRDLLRMTLVPEDYLNIASIDYSIATTSLDIFISGCYGKNGIHCKECHNPELWNFGSGTHYDKKLDYIKNRINDCYDLIDNIFVMGGEPLDQDHKELASLLYYLRGLNKKIWLFTRYNLDSVPNSIKKYCDYIKCGEYNPELKTNDNIQFGVKLATNNQMIHKII